MTLLYIYLVGLALSLIVVGVIAADAPPTTPYQRPIADREDTLAYGILFAGFWPISAPVFIGYQLKLQLNAQRRLRAEAAKRALQEVAYIDRVLADDRESTGPENNY